MSQTPQLIDPNRLHLFFNLASGRVRRNESKYKREISETFGPEFLEQQATFASVGDFGTQLTDWRDRHDGNDKIAVIAGGDGTLLHAASIFKDGNIPVATLPAGTFNITHSAHFNMHDDVIGGLRTLETGKFIQTRMPILSANEHLFLTFALLDETTLEFMDCVDAMRSKDVSKAIGHLMKSAFASAASFDFEHGSQMTTKRSHMHMINAARIITPEDNRPISSSKTAFSKLLAFWRFIVREEPGFQYYGIDLDPLDYLSVLPACARGDLGAVIQQDKLADRMVITPTGYEQSDQPQPARINIDGENVEAQWPLVIERTDQSLPIIAHVPE